MIVKMGTASLLALGLFVGLAVAEDLAPAATGGEFQLAQAADVPVEVQAFLDSQRPLAELSPVELMALMRQARSFAKQQGLNDDVRAQLLKISSTARAEMMKRDANAEGQPAAPEQSNEPAPAAEQPVEPPAEPAQTAEPPAEPAPAVEPPAEPAQTAEPPAVEPPAEPPKVDEQQTQQPAVKPRKRVKVEMKAVPETLAPAAAEAPPPPKLVPQAAPEGTVSPEFEKKAKAILADRRSPESLTMPELRQRLIAARDILAKNMLSASTEGALRKRLLADRNVFRARQAEVIEKEQAQQEAAAPPPKPAPGTAPVKPRKDANSASTPVREVLRDKRQAEELSPRDLRRRMRALREAEQGQVADAPPESGELRRERLERDRTVLRRRLLEEREQRRAELQREDVRIVLERAPVTTREVPRAVFEAETDEDDLERIIVSAPRRRITQRYTVEEVAAREDLRDTMPRIEIDTIRFGFGESFVREEEVGSLDRIALIIERVLRGNPNEVFLIEGHTDAVGSDAFNTNLSRQRAEAVKQALTTYYIIPGRNLKTVGLGERYLRIPTPEPEAENRRVSLIRATPLLGELQD